MSLTKQACIRSLEILNKEASRICDDLECENCCYETDNSFECKLEKSIKNLDQLIIEHFYNPSLLLKELHQDDVVWDSVINEWIKINRIIQTASNNYMIYFSRFNSHDECSVIFKKGRFYRKHR